jgi:ligand-binding sensor domain-containing protein
VCQIAVKIPDQNLDVQDIASIGDATWFATTHGAYRLQHGSITRVPSDLDVDVNKIQADSDAVWFATTSGAYRFEGGRTDRIPDNALDVRTLQVLSPGKVCLGTPTGALLIEDGHVRPIGPADLVIRDLYTIDTYLWLATDKGAYKVTRGDTLLPMSPHDTRTNDITKLQGATWISTSSGVYRLGDDGSKDVYLAGFDVRRILDVSGSIWAATSKGAYQFLGKTPRRIPDIEMPVESIFDIAGQPWVASNRGAFKVTEGQTTQIPSEGNISIEEIQTFNGQVWLGTNRGALVVRDEKLSRIPDIEAEVLQLKILDGSPWISTTAGSYRIIPGSVVATVRSANSLWKSLFQKLSPWPVVVSGEIFPNVKYVGPEGSLIRLPALSQPGFRVIIDTDESSFKDDIQQGNYSPATALVKNLSAGQRTLFIAARDKWGNTLQTRLPVLVIPSAIVTAIIIPCFWIAILSFLIVLSPTSDLANDLLMNPWLRAISSFGLIPLAMTVAPLVRRHVLKRYFRNLRRDREFTEILKRYEIPDKEFGIERFATRLASERVLFLTGQSGLGKTSYLKYLAGTYAFNLRLSNDRAKRASGNDVAEPSPRQKPNFLEGVIPVFVPLVRYRGQKIDDMIATQLSSYGRLTDKQLCSWYVDQGGFLFLFDGLNEVDEALRNDVNRFTDQVRHRSYCCISSQVVYPPFGWIQEIRLAYLRPENIGRIIQERLKLADVNKILGQFTPSTFELYKVPQDLEFLLQSLREHDGISVPQSKAQLYDRILTPVFEKWEQEGRRDFVDLLTKRAFEMVGSKDPLFNTSTLQPAPELVNPLAARKFLVSRDGGFYFQHNLIRDYLASVWIRDKWQTVLNENSYNVDSNWAEMLKFVLSGLDGPEDCEKIVFAILPKNRQLSLDLFAWLQLAKPSCTEGWASQFKQGYADAVLQS